MERIIDEVGMRYGRLVLVEKITETCGRTCWLCRCDCGTEKVIKAHQLHSGKTRSCGCLHKEMTSNALTKDEIGHRYGSLVVVSKACAKPGKGAFWECKCDCGNMVVRQGRSLREGKTKSCGCRNGHTPEIAGFNILLRGLKQKAKERGYSWELTEDEVHSLSKGKCFYCGSEPTQLIRHVKSRANYIYNGLDRIDNSLGYTTNNVVSCCGQCNKAKQIYSQDNFKKWVKRVYENWASK